MGLGSGEMVFMAGETIVSGQPGGVTDGALLFRVGIEALARVFLGRLRSVGDRMAGVAAVAAERGKVRLVIEPGVPAGIGCRAGGCPVDTVGISGWLGRMAPQACRAHESPVAAGREHLEELHAEPATNSRRIFLGRID